MGEDKGHRRGVRKGMTLLRALAATFKWRVALAGLLMICDSGVHITQVGAIPGVGAIIYFVCIVFLFMYMYGYYGTECFGRCFIVFSCRGCGPRGRGPCMEARLTKSLPVFAILRMGRGIGQFVGGAGEGGRIVACLARFSVRGVGGGGRG